MEFVRRGVEHAAQKREPVLPFCRKRGEGRIKMKGAPGQNTQDGIFDKMGRLADGVMDKVELFLGDGRKEPVQERTEIVRGMRGCSELGGRAKNDDRPEDQREPVFEQSARHC